MPFMYVRGVRIPDKDLWVKFEWVSGAYVARLDDYSAMGNTVEVTLSGDDDGRIAAKGGITLSSDMRPAERGVVALDSETLSEVTFCRFALDGDTEACGAFRIEQR
jgi:hypothetical protein